MAWRLALVDRGGYKVRFMDGHELKVRWEDAARRFVRMHPDAWGKRSSVEWDGIAAVQAWDGRTESTKWYPLDLIYRPRPETITSAPWVHPIRARALGITPKARTPLYIPDDV